MIPLLLHRRFASRKAWSDASYPVNLNLHFWVILPTHGPLQQAIFFVVNAKHGRGCMLHTDGHVALSLCLRRVVGPSLSYLHRCAAIEYSAGQRAASTRAASTRAASTRAFILFISNARPYVILLIIFGRTVQAIRNRPIRTSFYIYERK